MNENLFQERLRELEEAKKHSVPDTEREKDLAAAAHPKDKITHKDVLVKRGVLKAEGLAEGSATQWEVSFDYGPHMSKTVKVKAGSKEEARAKVEKAAEKSYTRGIMINWVKPAKQGVEIEEGIDNLVKGAALGGLMAVALHKRYGDEARSKLPKDKKDPIHRFLDTKDKKDHHKYKIDSADRGLKRAKKPETIERLNKQKQQHQAALKKTSYLKSVLNKEDVDLTEKKLTPAELKKREEVAKAMESDKPGMDKSKKMAIATAVAKRVAESMQINELSKTTLAAYYAKSISDRHSKDLARDSAKRKGDEKEVDALGRKVTNRSSGLEKAKAKFFKEDSDPTN